MKIDLPIGERLRLVAAQEDSSTYRLVLTGTLDHLAAPALAEAVRGFFLSGTVVILDLDGVQIYDPSVTMDLIALRREATKTGACLHFGGEEHESGARPRRHSRLGLLSVVRR